MGKPLVVDITYWYGPPASYFSPQRGNIKYSFSEFDPLQNSFNEFVHKNK